MGIDRKEVMRGALLDAAKYLIGRGEEDVSPPKLVLRVLTEAMDTLRRMKDREAAWLYGQRTLWPDIKRTYEERLEAYNEDIKRWISGEDWAEEMKRKTPASPLQIKRMYVIFDSFPYLIVGKDRRRDYRIVCGIAAGKSVRRVAVEARVSRGSVCNYRDLQFEAIARKLEDVMPTPAKIERLKAEAEMETEMRANRHADMFDSLDDLSVI